MSSNCFKKVVDQLFKRWFKIRILFILTKEQNLKSFHNYFNICTIENIFSSTGFFKNVVWLLKFDSDFILSWIIFQKKISPSCREKFNFIPLLLECTTKDKYFMNGREIKDSSKVNFEHPHSILKVIKIL